MEHYVVTLNDNDSACHGPFPNDDAARKWGIKWQADNGDNPCWQRVDLSADHPFALVAIAPQD